MLTNNLTPGENQNEGLPLSPHHLYKVATRFDVTGAELIDLIPEGDRKELAIIADEIDRDETKLHQYSEKAEKDLSQADPDYIMQMMRDISLRKVKASVYLEPIYELRRQRQTMLEKEQFVGQMSDAVKKFREELGKVKRPSFDYPAWLVAYRPNLWWQGLTLPTKQTILKWAQQHIGEKVPQLLRQFVLGELGWQVKIFPHAEYELAGVPCLAWYFRILVLVEAQLKLVEREFSKDFAGCSYQIKMVPGHLGSLYYGPIEWDYQGALTTPIALLALLAEGELEGEGIEVIERGSQSITFAVEGFEEETIELNDDFLKFIKDMSKKQPLAEALLARGLIDHDTVKLVQAKWEQLLPVTGKAAAAGAPDLESVVEKLVGVGWTEADAKKAVSTAAFPKNATAEDIVKIILAKSP